MRFCQSLMYAPAEDWVELTRCAEAVGSTWSPLSDHVFYPEKLESKYPYSADGRPQFEPDQPWPDVWVMAGLRFASRDENAGVLERFATDYIEPYRAQAG